MGGGIFLCIKMFLLKSKYFLKNIFVMVFMVPTHLFEENVF